MNHTVAVESLDALAQDARLAIFRLLVEAGPEGLPAGTIARELGLAASRLSFHLSRLEQSGLVHGTRNGRWIVYSADYTAMDALLAYLQENCCHRPVKALRRSEPGVK